MVGSVKNVLLGYHVNHKSVSLLQGSSRMSEQTYDPIWCNIPRDSHLRRLFSA
jgi:hypothetical protein